MAVKSNIKKYTIRHAKEAEGTQVEIPIYPTYIHGSSGFISKTAYSNEAIFKLGDEVTWVFEDISRDDLKELYSQIIEEKIDKYKSTSFVINTDLPGKGFITGKFKLDMPIQFKQSNNGEVKLYRCELHWIEVD